MDRQPLHRLPRLSTRRRRPRRIQRQIHVQPVSCLRGGSCATPSNHIRRTTATSSRPKPAGNSPGCAWQSNRLSRAAGAFAVEFVCRKYSCTNCTTIEPSPTAEATCFTEPARTSPAANTPGRDVSNKNGCRCAVQCGDCLTPGPVHTNPCLSFSISAGNQSVCGTAPIKLNTARNFQRAPLARFCC